MSFPVFQITDEQIEFAVKYWLSQLNSDDKAVKAKFEKALRKIIAKYRPQIRYMSIKVLPRKFLSEVLKLADLTIDAFPESHIQMFFHEKGTDVWKDGKYLFKNGQSNEDFSG